MGSEDQHQQLVCPVGEHAGAQTADGVADEGGAHQVAGLQAVHHGNMGAEIAAPAHAHGGEHGDIVGVGQAGQQQILSNADGGAGSAQCGDGHGNGLRALEAE